MDTHCAAMEGAQARSIKLDNTNTMPAAKQVLDITVLMGGPSTERDVSLVSGKAVADALERCGHHIVRSDISPADTSALDRKGIDVVFIALHGAFGESGEVQSLCEARGLRYVGSPPMASKLALDKAASKKVFRDAGILTPDWVVIEKSHTAAQRQELLKEFNPPVVVKPIDGGSSVDITIAKDKVTRDHALEAVVNKYGLAMLERFIKGREFTVGILGQDALPVIEIVVAGHEFYDYDAKYADGAGTQYVFEHGLPTQVVRDLQSAALAAHQSLGCRDMSRVDFIVDSSGRPFVLEINTIPGFTSHSLLPKAAQRVGISFDQLAGRIVEMAMRR